MTEIRLFFITFLSNVVEKIILKVDLPYATNVDN